MDSSVLVDYLSHLRATNPPSSSATLNRRLSMIRKLSYATAETQGDPTKDAKVTKLLSGNPPQKDGVQALTSDLLVQVLEAIDLNRPADQRDVALMLVGWFGALRPGELISLTTDLINTEKNSITIALHDRQVVIAAHPKSKLDPVERLKAWQQTLMSDRSNFAGDKTALWVATTKSGRISTPIRRLAARTLNDMIQRRTNAAGIGSGFSSHSLRAGFLAATDQPVVRPDWQ